MELEIHAKVAVWDLGSEVIEINLRGHVLFCLNGQCSRSGGVYLFN